VDGIERELAGTRIVRVSMMSRQGLDLARRLGVRGVPTLIVFDGQGQAVLRQAGRLTKQAVLDAVRMLEERQEIA